MKFSCPTTPQVCPSTVRPSCTARLAASAHLGGEVVRGREGGVEGAASSAQRPPYGMIGPLVHGQVQTGTSSRLALRTEQAGTRHARQAPCRSQTPGSGRVSLECEVTHGLCPRPATSPPHLQEEHVALAPRQGAWLRVWQHGCLHQDEAIPRVLVVGAALRWGPGASKHRYSSQVSIGIVIPCGVVWEQQWDARPLGTPAQCSPRGHPRSPYNSTTH